MSETGLNEVVGGGGILYAGGTERSNQTITKIENFPMAKFAFE